ncbi:MAG: excinuclease ABC subunit A, partial [Dehalococcoidia bacterium]
SRRATGRTLYILDEPTTGLSFEDTNALLRVLQRLVDAGNTVVVIEHHLDVIKSADHLIDLGPLGGDRGGYIVAEGTPEQVARVKKSYTGQYLRPKLAAARDGEPVGAVREPPQAARRRRSRTTPARGHTRRPRSGTAPTH